MHCRSCSTRQPERWWRWPGSPARRCRRRSTSAVGCGWSVAYAPGVPSSWRIDPVGPLHGDVMVRGSKNAVTKHMVAALLADGPCVVQNCPETSEVEITTGMLTSLGCVVEQDQDMITVDAAGLSGGQVPGFYGGRNRIPILLLGPLLHR